MIIVYCSQAPQREAQIRKTSKTAIFRLKSYSLEKVCYKVSLCENCQQQSCKAFIGLTIREKNDWWEATPST